MTLSKSSAVRSLVAAGTAFLAVAVFAQGASASSGSTVADTIARARSATAAFRDIKEAKAAGYGLLTDAKGIACIDNPGVGAMGIHYVNSSLVGNAKERAAHPEALVYEPLPGGALRLVAVEYVVIQSTWQKAHPDHAPWLYGHRFELVPAGNRYGLPPFYELHAWIWKYNPLGMFNDWNPRVTCAAA
jgi:hypothetical protein